MSMSIFIPLELDSMFTHHAPKDVLDIAAHEGIRGDVREVAHAWNDILPSCPEAQLAIRALQQAMMYANSAIAQHGYAGKVPPGARVGEVSPAGSVSGE